MPRRVLAFSRPFAAWHDRYQAYYQAGLRAHCASTGDQFRVVSLSRLPRTLRLLRRAQDAGYPRRVGGRALAATVDRMGAVLEGEVHPPSGIYQPLIGQYIVTSNGRDYSVCIDSADYPRMDSEELLSWSDLYFKTNAWSDVRYDRRVRPLVNGDPFTLDMLDELRAHRSTPKRYDLLFVVRVWGGKDNVEGIEHNLRLLEAINAIQCEKFVLAVLLAGDMERDARYLRSIGVPSTTGELSRRDLWQLTAKSRQVVIRLGVHHCVPWRMVGALAMGACVVLDRSPFSRWPRALRPNENFLDLELPVGPDMPVADQAAYDVVGSKIESWLGSPELMDEIAEQNVRYFDSFASPAQVGRYIMDTIETDLGPSEAAGGNRRLDD